MKSTMLKSEQARNLWREIIDLSDDNFLFEAHDLEAGLNAEEEVKALRDILKRGEQAWHNRQF